MKQIISEKQASFFTTNRFIEFAIAHEMPPETDTRDQWRDDPTFKKLIFQKLAPIALTLSRKKQLRMGLSAWIDAKNMPKSRSTLKEMFSIQGLIIGAVLTKGFQKEIKRLPLGIIPLPQEAGNVLFFHADLLLDWPSVKEDLCLILFAQQNAVYIQNSQDPQTMYLKKLGYQFGDLLENKTHPLIL